MLFRSNSAADKVKNLIIDEGNPALKFRAYITGGGCSGFQYGFTFDEEQSKDDYAVILRSASKQSIFFTRSIPSWDTLDQIGPLSLYTPF